MKGVSLTLAIGFIYERHVKTIKGIVEPAEELTHYDQAELVKSFCYLEDRLNASGRSEAPMTARTRTEWIKF